MGTAAHHQMVGKTSSYPEVKHTSGTTRISKVSLEMPSSILDALEDMRAHSGVRRTKGLPLQDIQDFAANDALLKQAIEDAWKQHIWMRCQEGFTDLLQSHEMDLTTGMSADFENFYDEHALQPFVPLAAFGPWVVTTHGAVVHDSGGYGMLGLGQNPPCVLAAMSKPQVMANIMTPSFSQAAFGRAIRKEVGNSRMPAGCPYSRFVCLNSGSEAVSFALRVTDIHAKKQTGPMGPHSGRRTVFVCLKGSFHGRTDGPAHVSDSTRNVYTSHLNSFQQRTAGGPPFAITVEPNNIEDLERAFLRIEQEDLHVQAMLFEPVMGEGNPGVLISRSFYDAARRLTREHHSLLLVDSVQAGFRAQGVLSIVDYPGFQDCEAPDFETWSKAINAGQFPLSIIAMSEASASCYVKGLYGNSMTANPRALDVACAVLGQFTPFLRQNIRERGLQMKQEFRKLQAEFPQIIESVTGTGLLVAIHINQKLPVVGPGGLEEACRCHGIGVIHGGQNALRFTPWFHLSTDEIKLITKGIRIAISDCLSHHLMPSELPSMLALPESPTDEVCLSPPSSPTAADGAACTDIGTSSIEPHDCHLDGCSTYNLLQLIDPVVAEHDRFCLYSDTSKTLVFIVSRILNNYYKSSPTALASLKAMHHHPPVLSQPQPIIGQAGPGTSNWPEPPSTLPKQQQAPAGPIIRHDHLAFRTFALRGHMSGIDSVAPFWEGLGYKRSSETLDFRAKKLRAKWFTPPMDLQNAPFGCPVPRIFISEVIVDELPWEAQEIIFKYAAPQHLDAQVAAAAMTNDAGSHLLQPPWGTPALEHFERLQELNPVAAWTLVHGYTLNHAAISTHWLKNPDLGELGERLLEAGIALNMDGGMMIKESPDEMLRQISTHSDPASVTFSIRNGARPASDNDRSRRSPVAGSYIEFVQRLVLPEHRHLPASDLREFHFRDGFEAINANLISASTNEVQNQE